MSTNTEQAPARIGDELSRPGDLRGGGAKPVSGNRPAA
jgi:hypothetical protein